MVGSIRQQVSAAEARQRDNGPNEKRSRFDQHEDEDEGGLQTKRDRKW